MNKTEEIELKSEEFQEVLGDVPSWILRRGISLVAAIVAILLIGSAIFKYPDTIASTMTLTGTTPPATIVAKSSGKLHTLFVKDDQLVKNGDYLAIIENPANTNDILLLKKYLQSLVSKMSVDSLPPKQLNLGEIQSLYSSFYMTLADYIQFNAQGYYLKKITFTKDRIAKNQIQYTNMLHERNIITQQFQLTRKQYVRDSILNVKGVLSNEDVEKTQTQYLQGKLSLVNQTSNLDNLQIQIAQMQESLLDIENEYTDKKNTFETQIRTNVRQLLTQIQTWEMAYVLTSPIDGKITFSNYWANNQNVQTGEQIFTIVPKEKGRIIGKAILPTARSGKVKVGQKVNIHFENFPDNEFGTVRGIVQNISLVPSKDSKQVNNYTVEIKLPNGLKTSYNKTLPYYPEMQAQADIITEDMTLLERFFLPMKKIWNESVK